ncbi:Exosome complex component RRP4 [Oopsacas minuta]|uniref:Exosome complex component RRP4 n=1 Tax=Oopsacas minuta TaxID=111878 RepID=A0AAV7JI20_9METZ|nr:Exosome complex component RRP4 [Oopsacas minuta]
MAEITAQHLHKGKKTVFVTPGEVITQEPDYMRGHGSYSDDRCHLRASVSGWVEKVNKLVCVRGLKGRYQGEVGDVVVGRVVEVGQKRWKVDTNAKLDSILHLASINLPGGVHRRRSEEDELLMREYFCEGELISAEVQQVYEDGSLSLHTRSLKYGKLLYGTLVKVPPYLIKPCKSHFHNLSSSVSILIGKNGWIWISPRSLDTSADQTADKEDKEPDVTPEIRSTIARLVNCIQALVSYKVLLYETSISCCYEESLKYSELIELLKPDVQQEIVLRAINLDAIS